MGWGGSNDSRINPHICVPNLVTARQSSREGGGGVQTDGYTGTLHLYSRVAQGAYLEVEYIRNVLSVSGTLKYADSGTA